MFQLTHCLTLLDKLLTTINTVFVPIEPLPRMLFLAAVLGENASVYHLAAGRAVTDWWVGAAVVHVWTGVRLHFCFLHSMQICRLSAVSVHSPLSVKDVMLN